MTPKTKIIKQFRVKAYAVISYDGRLMKICSEEGESKQLVDVYGYVGVRSKAVKGICTFTWNTHKRRVRR